MKKHDVTPEMIDAGFKVLRDSGISDELLATDEGTVADIYRAMHEARVAEVDRIFAALDNHREGCHLPSGEGAPTPLAVSGGSSCLGWLPTASRP